MKSFRAEREKKDASWQILLVLLMLLASVVLVRLLPAGNHSGDLGKQNTNWEASIVKLP